MITCCHLSYCLDPDYFWVLTTLSAGMVVLATVTYSVTRPDNKSVCGCCGCTSGADDNAVEVFY